MRRVDWPLAVGLMMVGAGVALMLYGWVQQIAGT